ncbi:DUF2500 domain-containing protein [Sporosarcina limicola]|uniref:DUF2500 domain-containing protein n=1 Tax=Sporosarcina limicola TaxID=34101 RepID=A0A927RBR9_9BACL|nr:DUF2500 domain-containing protein [Sporosarcina limicola]MBE1553665.1 hypothetical protein [Sporosarcina limicola]
MFSPFGDSMFTIIPVFIGIVAIIIFGVIIFAIVKGIGEWSSNNDSPQLTVPATVITKRTKTSGGRGDSSASTSYYVTFQVESGDRMELRVKGSEYGMLAEGDFGMLAFQGTRYLEFKRGISE